MTLFAGIVFSDSADKNTRDLASRIEQYFSHFPAHMKSSHASKQHFLINVDNHAFGDVGWVADDARVTAIAGHPLLSGSRQQDALQLHETQLGDQQLCDSEGMFAACQWDAPSATLTLANCVLGLIPIYYRHYKGAFIFSTQMKVLCALGLPNTPNSSGLTEYSTLGYFLLDHTPYLEIKCALPATKIVVSSGGVQQSTYFDWQKLAQQQYEVDDASKGIASALINVSQKYLHGDSRALATLSGGLDSRLINALLKRCDADVVSLNFSTPDTLDQHCAQAFADHLEIPHYQIPVRDTQETTVEMMLGKYWRDANHPQYHTVDRPNLSWSGNGGSVGLGLVFFSDPVYEATHTGSYEAVIDAYLAQQFAYMPASVIHHADKLQAVLRRDLVESLAQFSDLPLDKAFQLFLLLNDQRHHIMGPNEEADLHQMDFCYPFYSWKVLQYPLGLPVTRVRKHRFYIDMLEAYFPETVQVPWQAYPGHVPCPLPIEGHDQWKIDRSELLDSHEILYVLRKTLKSRQLSMIRKIRFVALCGLHILKLKNATDSVTLIKRILRWQQPA